MSRTKQQPYLHLPAKPLRCLLREEPTPFYLYDEEELTAACRAVYDAFSWNEGFSLVFPVRMNPNPAILRALWNAGCGALCGSEAELLSAKQAEVKSVLFAPCALEQDDFRLAEELGAGLILDGAYAMPPREPRSLFLSMNPGGKLYYKGRAVLDMSRSKLGMNDRELQKLCGFLKLQRPEKFGLAIYLRDQEEGTEKFCAAAQALFSSAKMIYEKFGLAADSLMIAGGLGAQEDRESEKHMLLEASARVKESYAQSFAGTDLSPAVMLAPGRLLAARSGVLISRVLARKEREQPLLILDMDCSQFLREIAFGAGHHVLAPLAPAARSMQRVKLAGALCDVRDHFSGSFVLPELKPGECVMICGAGADGHSFSSAYGGRGICAEFLLRKDKSVQKIRAARPAQALFAQEFFRGLEHGKDKPEADDHPEANDRRKGEV